MGLTKFEYSIKEAVFLHELDKLTDLINTHGDGFSFAQVFIMIHF